MEIAEHSGGGLQLFYQATRSESACWNWVRENYPKPTDIDAFAAALRGIIERWAWRANQNACGAPDA